MGRIAGRYAPVLALIALQLAILTLAPASGRERAASVASSPASGAIAIPLGEDPTSVSVGAQPGDGATTSGGARPSGGASAGGVGAVPVTTAFDALGRPVDGDRSKCAPDGVRQVDIALVAYSPPCIPAFTGDNGDATYRGVSGDTIRIVRYRGLNGDELDAVLSTQGLAATKDEERAALEVFEQFFNRHYETYGRKVELIQYDGTCNIVEADMSCFRADAKALVKKHDPFMVIAMQLYWQIGDELAKLGVPSTGTSWGKDRAWFTDRRPMFWELVPDGDTVVEMIADYWCTKLEGRPADRAGDPALTVQTRRLGILVPEDPAIRSTGRRLQALLSGDRCGSAATAPTLYAHADEAARAQEQFPNIAAQMKADGVTTVTVPNSNFFYNLAMTRAFDQQAYFPEHLLSGTGASDHDAVGRLASPSQWEHAFGPSWMPMLRTLTETDGYRAAKSVDPAMPYDSAIHNGTFDHLQLVLTLVQAAGPRLTPETMEQGIFGFPQVGGWSGGEAWAGWACCNPHLPLHKWGTYSGDYTGHKDVKEVYWDSQAPGAEDGKPGAYVCAEGCRRFTVGQWTDVPPPGG